jgi:hypothetical protein
LEYKNVKQKTTRLNCNQIWFVDYSAMVNRGYKKSITKNRTIDKQVTWRIAKQMVEQVVEQMAEKMTKQELNQKHQMNPDYEIKRYLQGILRSTVCGRFTNIYKCPALNTKKRLDLVWRGEAANKSFSSTTFIFLHLCDFLLFCIIMYKL